MKIVIDTSVWISALITKESKAREILRLVFKNKLFPQISEALFKGSCYEEKKDSSTYISNNR